MIARKTNDGKKGGLLAGRPHKKGGIKAVVADTGQPVELEGGEVIINKHASKKHWKELSRINQSAGGGVPILSPKDMDDADVDEYKKGGRTIEFNPNKTPSYVVYTYAKTIKDKYPKVWNLGGNIFGNEAFDNLERVLKRGYWTENEEWMFVKWQSFCARHKGDIRIAGIIANLKWLNKVDKGWGYMKELIEDEINKRYPKIKKMGKGGVTRNPALADIKSLKSETLAEAYHKAKADGTNPKLVKAIEDLLTKKKLAKGGKLTYKNKYNDKYDYPKNESHNLAEIAKDTGKSVKGLQKIYNKGIGAYKTNPQSVRPNVKSKEQWAMARVYSAVMGGKAARIDAKELKMAKGKPKLKMNNGGIVPKASTDPSTWNAKFNVGDKVKIRYDFSTDMGTGESKVRYESNENSFAIKSIEKSGARPYKENARGDNIGGFMRPQNPSGVLYKLSNGQMWEGKDLELISQGKTPEAKPSNTINKPKAQPKTIAVGNKYSCWDIAQPIFTISAMSTDTVTVSWQQNGETKNYVYAKGEVEIFLERKLWTLKEKKFKTTKPKDADINTEAFLDLFLRNTATDITEKPITESIDKIIDSFEKVLQSEGKYVKIIRSNG